MKYFSTFSGIGGFEAGIERAIPLAECVGYSEINGPAIKTYEEHFEHKNYGDITTINPSELPEFDLLVGGFPCQAFSIAGVRKGFDDTRGTLFFDVARILADKRPRHLVLENVKGLLSHDDGKTVQTIFRILTDLGYFLEWQVLNSKNHGVPQNRERIYIVGHLGGLCGQQIFPIRDSSPSRIKEITHNAPQSARAYDPSGLSPTLDIGGGGVRQPKVFAVMEVRTEEAKRIRREYQKIGRDYSPRRSKYLIPKPGGVVGTITATRNFDNMLIDNMRPRLFTPIEYERLQGFPDNWTVGTDNQRYKQCGNAVTVNVVEAVMRRLEEHCSLSGHSIQLAHDTPKGSALNKKGLYAQ